MVGSRRALGAALLQVAPWLADAEHGPRTVDAGTCGRCGQEPRLLATCGPLAHEALCRTCALHVGEEAWCPGHQEEGRQARRWARELPARWADLVILWWVSTGELGPADPGVPPVPHDLLGTTTEPESGSSG